MLHTVHADKHVDKIRLHQKNGACLNWHSGLKLLNKETGADYTKPFLTVVKLENLQTMIVFLEMKANVLTHLPSDNTDMMDNIFIS